MFTFARLLNKQLRQTSTNLTSFPLLIYPLRPVETFDEMENEWLDCFLFPFIYISHVDSALSFLSGMVFFTAAPRPVRTRTAPTLVWLSSFLRCPPAHASFSPINQVHLYTWKNFTQECTHALFGFVFCNGSSIFCYTSQRWGNNIPQGVNGGNTVIVGGERFE